ncbi:ead/Ea22-like family protein [Halopseudomonas sp. SMJS2]|uniref:ead/Ea22-like family protein n=1 Tax=Halopseudomonas sp. SMJS2 TaxID=3041098 RepID=UPI0024531A0B|nr:ead/Ea22-like family protein [Halopseudomonas sp. SMJS2]WGK60533.1 ead/Ea22-like family protein [Halopseudomonas sp. SMJS2]
MSKADKQQLRELAEKAGAKQWSWWTSCSFLRLTFDGERDGGALSAFVCADGVASVSCSEGVQEFIEAASPATVLGLLDEIETLEGLYRMHKATEERQMIDLRAEVKALRKDAELYRALRAMHWNNSPLAVVRNPKLAIKPGHDCPGDERLDEAILEAIAGGADRGR